MNLTVLAYALIGTFMVLIMSKRLSVLTALVLVPIVYGLIGGFGSQIGAMMLDGVRVIAPTGVMLMFAILYFSLMIDAGLFDPAVRRVVKVVGGDPLKICLGTAFLALFISLDGDGATTYLICTTAMLPLYQKLGMSRLILASIIMQAGGVMNILPWGGPTARAAAALKVDPAQLFVPLIPAMFAGACWVVFVAWIFGRRERARLGVKSREEMAAVQASALTRQEYEAEQSIRRPKLFWFNLTLTMVLMACLVLGVLPLSILFMIAAAIALIVNYPKLEDQKARIAANAANVFAVVVVIFAAGVFTGILSGTKMIDAMALSVVNNVPPALGPYLAVITGILSLPFTFFISNDAFYYGVVPVLAEAGAAYGITAAEIGRASLIGQPVHLLSPLVPSTYLLVGLCGIELGDHQRFTLKWSAITSLVILTTGLVIGVVPWVGTSP
jgi:citrate-Mg2+:H+ or citrate-Ca2+:H+ symporter, CitMHS family